ncbi:MAG: YbhB/YbcL family Raf kinase inhibitor-like protein [Chloroflexota bacterium]
MKTHHLLLVALCSLFLFGSGLLLAQSADSVTAPTDFVDLDNDGFNPQTAVVSLGTNVTWLNQTDDAYVIQSGYPYSSYLPAIRQANDGRRHMAPQLRHTLSDPFSGNLPAGGNFSHRFDEAGHFPYFAISEHGKVVTAVILVEAPPATSTPTATSVATATPVPTETPSPTPTTVPTDTPVPTATQTAVFALSSPAFAEGGEIATQYTFNAPPQCSGQNISVPLAWEGVPVETVSFALIMDDPDAGDFVHWVQFNIPAGTSSLPELIGGPNIGNQGRNDFGQNGYGGPCPPSGTHRYLFKLYALDTTLSLGDGASKANVLAAMETHTLAEAQLTGVRSR